jgi:hypothetical protein
MEHQELIICECMEELSITQKTTCPKCSRIILTSKELKELQREVDTQICNLKVQSHQIAIELSLRNMRKPSRPYLVESDFYNGLRGKRGEFTKKERSRQELSAEAMTLLGMV